LDDPLTLCVLLWARPGCEAGLATYEDKVLVLIAEHDGRLLQRARANRGGSDAQPREVQLIEFGSQAAFDAYLADERRTAMAGERDAVVARTEVIDVTLVPGPATA